MAYDDSSEERAVFQAIERLQEAGIHTRKMFFYVLVGDDIADALQRVMELDYIGANPFAQPYRDFENNTPPGKMQRAFARWVNHKACFNSCTWAEYKAKIKLA